MLAVVHISAMHRVHHGFSAAGAGASMQTEAVDIEGCMQL